MTGWDSDDVRALHQIGAGLGSFQVLRIEENRMNDQTPEPEPEGRDWEEGFENAAGRGATYPEYPYKLADHVYTWSPKLPDGSMLVIRAQSAEGLAEAAEAVAAVTGRLRAAWQQATLAPQAPAQGYQQAPQGQYPPQGGVNYSPQTPPPNQPYPGQPAWQQAGAPQGQPQQGWGGAPQGGGQQWGNGGQQAAQGGQKPAYPAPQGWWRLDVPYPGGKDQLAALAQQLGIPKGNPGKGGKFNYFQAPVKAWYCAPEVVQALAQFNPMAA